MWRTLVNQTPGAVTTTAFDGPVDGISLVACASARHAGNKVAFQPAVRDL
jgi:hypothetical protein